MTYTFKLSTPTQPKVVSDTPAVELTVPAGEVTFNVTNPVDEMLTHDFEVCSTPLPGPVKTLAGVQALPNTCSGTTTPMLAPGSPNRGAHDRLHDPGAYEYLSTVGGPSGDASAGMKGVLNIT